MSDKTTGKQKKRMRGVVKSDKMEQSITVTVERLVADPRYGKYLRRRKTFMAHNPQNYAKAGDLVEIESTRPLSARKRWRLVKVLKRVEAAPAGAAAAPAVESEAPNAEGIA
jgi:small subunit ribosomal protein S17